MKIKFQLYEVVRKFNFQIKIKTWKFNFNYNN